MIICRVHLPQELKSQEDRFCVAYWIDVDGIVMYPEKRADGYYSLYSARSEHDRYFHEKECESICQKYTYDRASGSILPF